MPVVDGELVRERLPERRPSEVFKMEWQPSGTADARDVFVRYSWQKDGRIAEVFLGGGEKDGTDLRALMNDTAILISVALQYGIPLDALGKSLARTQDNFEGPERPASLIGQVIERLIEEQVRHG